ncbi:hypothetical protein C0J26_09440 [Pseudomonas baetica]|uniref:acyl carrier protein n=1 Tax=Pseudomonas baetica TaxID=674054 RepID=UPI000D1DA14B|nr:acyl carrier protein [Pseudomonas baetica]PTC20185.1 hypothetical protein C0J26_09440 [Pseudomonas baetica]
MTYLNAFIDKVSSQSISDAQALDLIRQLHESVQQPAPAPARGTLVEQQVLAELSGFLVATIHLDQGEIEPERSLADYGFNSISLTEFSQRIGARFPGLRLASSTFMEHPSLAALARHIAPRAALDKKPRPRPPWTSSM